MRYATVVNVQVYLWKLLPENRAHEHERLERHLAAERVLIGQAQQACLYEVDDLVWYNSVSGMRCFKTGNDAWPFMTIHNHAVREVT